MALETVNGLNIYLNEAGLEFAITARQIDLIREAITACGYDWYRLGGCAPIDFQPVSEESLYAGHIGIGPRRPEYGASIALPYGGTSSPVYAPLRSPDQVGPAKADYGGLQVFPPLAWEDTYPTGPPAKFFYLEDLDRRSSPYGGARFFKETIIRCLGQYAAIVQGAGNVFLQDKLLRCFTPTDRSPFGPFTYSSPSPTLYDTYQWWCESLGLVPESVAFEYMPTQTTWSWETRAIEAVGEIFKDLFLPESERQFTNRTSVGFANTPSNRREFFACFLDYLPYPRDSTFSSGIFEDIAGPEIHTVFTFTTGLDIYRSPELGGPRKYPIFTDQAIDEMHIEIELAAGDPAGNPEPSLEFSNWYVAKGTNPITTSELIRPDPIDAPQDALLPIRVNVNDFTLLTPPYTGVVHLIYTGIAYPEELGEAQVEWAENIPDEIFTLRGNAPGSPFDWKIRHRWFMYWPSKAHPELPPAGWIQAGDKPAGKRLSSRAISSRQEAAPPINRA